ncbi:MAG TPA: 3-deoxy-7-phosphoheptulonate synthase, partial [Thermoanaerobaculia bacterium]|nr:3-deoxy-7-phosphoheptulonate synthase [Thermoanaerobaculia bacterium]
VRANGGGDRPAVRAVFQGVPGAYSHLAARSVFGDGPEVAYDGLATFAEAVAAVQAGAATHAVLPVENTTAGSVHPVYDLLLETRLAVVAEAVLRVEHCLIGLEEVPLPSLRRILSHWQALAQCSRFLSGLPDARPVPWEDTALAVAKVKEDGDPTQAAIASEEAARRHGLPVLRRQVADERENLTRFLVLAREPVRVDLRVPAKTSLLMGTAHRPGSLLTPLAALERHGLNLTKLESRPRKGSPFEYLFYLDFEGNVEEPRVRAALDSLRASTSFCRVLGCYPSARRPRATPSPRALAGASPATSKRVAPRGTSKRVAPRGGETVAAPSRLVDRTPGAPSTVVRVGDVEVGGGAFVVIAGPCAVETPDQVMACAREVKEHGGHMLRGGCFKPRTSPYSFQGLGWEGLELLTEAGRRFDLPVVTEVLSPGDVERVAERADVLQVGARNMQNFSLLKEVGRVDRPVLLKRGLSASLDELLNAAEYVLAQGNRRVILCERGIRTFETATRSTLDLGAVALLARLTHLPVIVDPSHAAGKRELVAPLALAARAVGPHGLMVEIHPEPETALSDGPQALPFPEFADLMRDLRRGAGTPRGAIRGRPGHRRAKRGGRGRRSLHRL